MAKKDPENVFDLRFKTRNSVDKKFVICWDDDFSVYVIVPEDEVKKFPRLVPVAVDLNERRIDDLGYDIINNDGSIRKFVSGSDRAYVKKLFARNKRNKSTHGLEYVVGFGAWKEAKANNDSDGFYSYKYDKYNTPIDERGKTPDDYPFSICYDSLTNSFVVIPAIEAYSYDDVYPLLGINNIDEEAGKYCHIVIHGKSIEESDVYIHSVDKGSLEILGWEIDAENPKNKLGKEFSSGILPILDRSTWEEKRNSYNDSVWSLFKFGKKKMEEPK